MRTILIVLRATLSLVATMSINGCNSTTDPAGSGGSSTNLGTGGSGTNAATGGTSAGGANGLASVTNLSGTKALSALTAAEASQLCSDALAYYRRTISKATMCKAQGLTWGISSSAPTDEVLQQTCKTKEESCLQAEPQPPVCDAFPSQCTSTVAMYSACITDYAAWYNQSVSGLVGCAEYARKDLPVVWDFVTAAPQPSCATLNDNCAGVNYPTPS